MLSKKKKTILTNRAFPVRTCASCAYTYWGGWAPSNWKDCPKCGFGHYGALYVYGKCWMWQWLFKTEYRKKKGMQSWIKKLFGPKTTIIEKRKVIEDSKITFLKWTKDGKELKDTKEIKKAQQHLDKFDAESNTFVNKMKAHWDLKKKG